MSVTPTYPGVYVREESSGARAVSGVATSVALFVGQSGRGRMNQPIRLHSMADFEREFGATTPGELADQVRQFYLNGGGESYVCRIADGAVRAGVMLRSEQGDDALQLLARDHGIEGNLIRAEIDYGTASPERTFNLTVFRSRLLGDGTRTREDVERFEAVSMNPALGNFVESAVNGTSALVTVTVQHANAPATIGRSIAGRVLPQTEADVDDELDTLVTASANALRIAVAGHPAVTVTLSEMGDIPSSDTVANIAARWESEINAALSSNGVAAAVTVDITASTLGGGGVAGGRLLRVTSTDGPVVVTPAATNDVSVALMLGAAAGGLEGDSFGDFRPAPTGLVGRSGTAADGFEAWRRFAGATRNNLTFELADDSPEALHTVGVTITGNPARMYEDSGSRNFPVARAVLDNVAAMLAANTNDRWKATRQGFRLVLTPAYGNDNTGPAAALTSTGGYNIGAANQPFAPGATGAANVAAYTVGEPGGSAGGGTYQVNAVQGLDGATPQPSDYADAYEIVESEVDLFNLLVLPRADGQSDDDRKALWGPASAFCERERAFLIVDPRAEWSTITQAEQGVDTMRIGVETRNAAAYWPRLRVADGSKSGRPLDPAGSIAGLMARTDANRGVWKAPAGLEATIRGVIGVDRPMSDPENGVLNPKALNALRVFPSGVVSWGARTLVGFNGSGNIDDKYVPVRRTMLFIEESLYRGLRFAVFEPNDEPLWAQIRLAAGSFMNRLFRQGAFAGEKVTDAYFVACDATTTTDSDINLGIVNVIVGFAPLKPAEFVVLTVKQIAGQAQV